MIIKPCFMKYSSKEKCKELVDVDNGFGHVMDDEVWCEKHKEIGQAYLKSVEIIKKQQDLTIQERKLSDELQKPLRFVRDNGIIL